MKKLGLLGIAFVFLTLSSCAVSKNNAVSTKNIVGTWCIEEVDMSALLSGIPEEERAMAEAFLPMMEEAMKSMEMTFEKAGKFTMKASIMGQDQKELGTWSLSDDGKVLTTKTKVGAGNKMNIASLSGNKMVVNSDMDGQTVKMTFVKK